MQVFILDTEGSNRPEVDEHFNRLEETAGCKQISILSFTKLFVVEIPNGFYLFR